MPDATVARYRVQSPAFPPHSQSALLSARFVSQLEPGRIVPGNKSQSARQLPRRHRAEAYGYDTLFVCRDGPVFSRKPARLVPVLYCSHKVNR